MKTRVEMEHVVHFAPDHSPVTLRTTSELDHTPGEAERLLALVRHTSAFGLPAGIGAAEWEALLFAALRTDDSGRSLLGREELQELQELLCCGAEELSRRLRALRDAQLNGRPLIRERQGQIVFHPRLLGLEPPNLIPEEGAI